MPPPQETTIVCKGSKLFNLLPAEMCNIEASNVDTFKFHLDQFLTQIADQPTVQGQTQIPYMTRSLC